MAHRGTHRHNGTQKSHMMSSNIEIKRICEFCKNEFTARTTRTRYCSHKCNSRHYKVLERNEKVEKSNQETVKILNVDLEKIKHREFLNITQASNLFGISRRTVYRLINRGEVNIAKLGKRSVLKRCDLESFFAIPIVEQTLKPVQLFPGVDHCYTIGQIQDKFKISPAALYHMIKRHGISKYSIGKFTYVPKADIEIIFKGVEL